MSATTPWSGGFGRNHANDNTGDGHTAAAGEKKKRGKRWISRNNNKKSGPQSGEKEGPPKKRKTSRPKKREEDRSQSGSVYPDLTKIR